MSDAMDPRLIPAHKKKQFLASLSEDSFRDQIVRPLLLHQGLVHGKDTCGVDEEGKDSYFWQDDKVRGRVLVAVQTKKGNLKLSANAKDNLVNATTQVATALKTNVHDSKTKQKFRPSYVLLVVSGEINNAARRHITEECNDPNIVFKDANDLVTEIDELIPEIWNGIDAAMMPYLKRLREYVLAESVTIDVTAIGVDLAVASPITNDTFAQIYVNRIYPKTERHGRDVEERLEFEDIPVQELLLRNDSRILLTGDAGCGKSTALYRLAVLLIEGCLHSPTKNRLPVVLTAREVSQSQTTLADFAGQHTKSLTIDGNAAFGMEWLQGGRIELLIDGLDELGNAEERKIVLDKIRDFSAAYPTCQVILSSRDYLYVRDIVVEYNLSRFRITPLSVNQASRMISRLASGKSLSSTETEETLRRLEDIHGLQLNPLLITVFVATSDYARSDVPANITEIFKKFTEVMLGRWGATKGISQQYQAPLKDFLLQRIAFDLHTRKETSLSVSECKTIIDKELRDRGHAADIEVLFEEIVFRSGLMRVHAGEVEFVHLLIQEFFAGRAIPSPDFLGTVVSDIWWTKAVVFYFGENPGDSHGLQALRAGLDGIVGADEFQAAVAVGLAAQACYLMRSTDKIAALKWVVETLAGCKEAALLEVQQQFPDMEIVPLLHYYHYGRDAVAASAIEDVLSALTGGDPNDNNGCVDEEIFWCLAGLIEARRLDNVLKYAKKFNPKDVRLILALQLGARYVQHVHITDPETKAKAKEIADALNKKVAFLHSVVIRELKSLLLEVRRGKLLPASVDTSTLAEAPGKLESKDEGSQLPS
jgi:hypothetical protein